MAQPNDLRFSFKDETDSLWYYYQGGQAKTSTAAKYLSDDAGNVISPLDWKNVQLGLTRSDKYWGLFSKYGVPVQFTFQALQILKYFYAQNGYEGTIIFIIDMCQNDWTYKEIYRGELDLSNIENSDSNEANGVYFKTNVAERGLVELIQSQDDIPFEIPFDSDYITINHDGIKIKSTLNYVTGDLSGAPAVIQASGSGQGFIFPMSLTKEVPPYVLAVMQPNAPGLQIWALSSTPTDVNKFLYTDINFTAALNLQGQVIVNNVAGVANLQLIVEIVKKDWVSNTLSATTLYASAVGLAGSSTQTVSFIGNYSFNFRIYNYFLNIRCGGSSLGAIDIGIKGVTFDMNFTSRAFATDIKAFKYPVFLDKLFKKALGNGVSLVSDYLTQDQSSNLNYDNNPKWTCVASGSSVRNLPNAKIKTSISDAFQDMKRWGLGLDIEGTDKVRVERLPYFFQKNRVVITLDNIKNFKYRTAVNYLGNKLSTGYKNVTIDDVNALDDFNTETIWNYPSKRVTKEIKWTSLYFSSIYAIETARALGILKQNTTDSQFDDEIYLMEVNKNSVAGKYILNRPTNPNQAFFNLLNPDTAYNAGITPASSLLFNRELLTAMGYGKLINNNETIKHQTSDKNSNFIRHWNSIVITESGDYGIQNLLSNADGSAVTPLFQPVEFEYEAVIPVSLIDLIRINPQNKYGVIQFPYNDKIFANFMTDIAILPATKDTYKIIGLSSPDNDLKQL